MWWREVRVRRSESEEEGKLSMWKLPRDAMKWTPYEQDQRIQAMNFTPSFQELENNLIK